MYFEKYQGTGNDYIIIEEINVRGKSYTSLAKIMCDRHFGIGADGILIIEHSEIADIKLRIINSDGSEASMCGNGIRCLTKYVLDHNIVKKPQFNVETLAGIKTVKLHGDDSIRVNMGQANMNAQSIGLNTNKNEVINEKINIDGKDYYFSVVDMGILHTILFVDTIKGLDTDRLVQEINDHPIFPHGTNVNFAEIVDSQHVKVITHEQGVGYTLASGTGSCAVYKIGKLLNKIDDIAFIYVLGGSLLIEENNNELYLTGIVKQICSGEYYE